MGHAKERVIVQQVGEEGDKRILPIRRQILDGLNQPATAQQLARGEHLVPVNIAIVCWARIGSPFKRNALGRVW